MTASNRAIRNGARSVFIATTPRSGSWLLAEGLAELGVAGEPEEFFSVDLEPIYREQWGVGATAPYPELIEQIIARGTTPNGVFAAKLHWFQLVHLLHQLRAVNGVRADPDGLLLRTRFGEFQVVYLERRDTLRQAVSWLRAIRSGVWWRLNDTSHDTGQLEYDFEATKNLYYLLMDYKASWRAWLAAHAPDAMTLYYEDLATDYPRALRAVLRYLHLPEPANISAPALRRQADGTTEAFVAAYRQSWTDVFQCGPPPVMPNAAPFRRGSLTGQTDVPRRSDGSRRPPRWSQPLPGRKWVPPR
jgi:LPS sulfotransferase NodH